MKSIYKDPYDLSETFETEDGRYIHINKDAGMNPYYHVTVGSETVATRCRYDKAMEIVKKYAAEEVKA